MRFLSLLVFKGPRVNSGAGVYQSGWVWGAVRAVSFEREDE